MARPRRFQPDDIPEILDDDSDGFPPEPEDEIPSPPPVPRPRARAKGYAPASSHSAPPPLAAIATRNPHVSQLRVQRLENGRPQELGYLSSGATTTDLLAKWPRPGTYWLWPVDMQGQELEANPGVLDIPADHEALKAALMHNPSASPQSSASFDILATIERLNAAHREEIMELRQELALKEQRLSAEMKALSEQRLNLGVTAADAAIEMHAKIVDKDQDRANTFLAQMSALAERQREADKAAAMMQTQAIQAQHNILATLMDRASEAAQLRLDREREEMKLAAQERERTRKDEQERYERGMREREKERAAAYERDRDRDERLLALNLEMIKAKERHNPLNNLSALIGDLAGMKDTLSEVLPGLLGGSKPESLTETVVKGAIEIFKAQAQAQAQAQLAGMADDDEEDDEEDEEPQRPLIAAQVDPAQVAAAQQEALRRQSQAVAAALSMGEAPPPTNATAQPTVKPAVAALPRNVTKQARRGLATIREALSRAPEAQWMAIVTSALGENEAIIPYLRAAGIKPALEETGAPTRMVETVINQLRALNIVPADIPWE